MLDHHDARLWADHHADFGAWVSRVIAQVRQAFDVLASIQYAEPWKTRDATPGSASRTDGSACRCPA